MAWQRYALEDAESLDEDGLEDEDDNLKQNADPEYKNLIAIRARKRKGGVKDWFHDDPTSATRISLKETSLENAVISHRSDVIRYLYVCIYITFYIIGSLVLDMYASSETILFYPIKK